MEPVTLPGESDSPTAAHPARWRFSLSPAWKFCCGLAALAVCLHFYACLFGWRREDQGMFIQFAPLPAKRQFFLIGLGWATIGSIAILMLQCSSKIGDYLEKSNSLWISVLYVVAWLACLGIVLDILLRSFGEPRSARILSLIHICGILQPERSDCGERGHFPARAVSWPDSVPTEYASIHGSAL